MRIKIVFAVLFLILALKAQNQTTTVDSLLRELPKATSDTVRARIYIRLHDNLRFSNPEKALSYAGEGLKIVHKMKWDKGLSVFYNDIGNNFLDQGKHKEALGNFLKSLEYSGKIPSLRALTLQNIGIVYFKEENIPMAMQYNNQAFGIAGKNNLTATLGACCNTYGDIYSYQNNIANAKAFYLKALDIWKKENNPAQQATVLMHLGEISTDIKTRIAFYKQSKAIWDSENPSYLLAVSNILGLAGENINLYQNDSLYKKTALGISKKQLLVDAEKYLTDAVNYSKQSNVQQNLMFAYGKLSELEEARGNYKKALEYINLNYEIYISIFSQENKNKIATLESRQKLLAKDKEIAIKKLSLQQKQKQQWYYIGVIFLLSIIGGLLFYQSRNRKKINQKLQLLNSELDQANNAKIKFLGILNHDLRSPVSNLIDFLHLQKDSPDLLDDKTKNRIEKSTLTSAENLLTSMEDILQWSKSQMENFKPQPRDVFINSVFEDTKNHFSGVKKVNLLFENPDNIQINTDENYLKTILRNLTGNAIKALIDVENPTIIWKAFQKKNKIYLSVTDNGPGANKAQFKALYNDKEVAGIKTGLGLHLIRDLATAIDCEITVDTRVGFGTTILLALEQKSGT